jgi:hypothetical protein
MGLMFQMPLEENELDDRIEFSKENNSLRLRSYGLPMIFWGYLAAVLSVVFFMILAIKAPILKILSSDDALNHFLAYCVISLFIFGPLIAVGFYFYEKEIFKQNNKIKVIHKVFFIALKTHHIEISADNQLTLIHLLDSPNVAKAQKKDGMAGFENRGYYQVFVNDTSGKRVLVDRNSRRGEMKKLVKLLSQ